MLDAISSVHLKVPEPVDEVNGFSKVEEALRVVGASLPGALDGDLPGFGRVRRFEVAVQDDFSRQLLRF